MTELRLSTHARKAYERLARSDQRLFTRVDGALDRIGEDPEAGKPLVGPLVGHRSLRVGKVRIIYRWDRQASTVLVLDIAFRKDAYR